MNRATDLLDQVLRSVRRALPDGWTATLLPRPASSDGGRDAVMAIISPTGASAEFAVVAKLSTRSPALVEPRYCDDRPVLYVEQYLPLPARDRLAAAGVSYADATGWVRLVSDDPMIAIIAQGAPRAPKRDQRLVTTRLDGPGTGRIIRALVGTSPPIGVRALAATASVSPGTVSKVLPTLVAEGTIERDQGGRVIAVDRIRLMERWTEDYGLLKSNGRPAYYVAPRGIDSALEQVRGLTRTAITGGEGGALWLPEGTAPLIPTTQLVAYTAMPDGAAAVLGLVPVDAPVANAILMEPQDLTILDAPARKNDTPVAPLPVVLADLLTLPGRYPQQAEALMDALAKTDPEWSR